MKKTIIILTMLILPFSIFGGSSTPPEPQIFDTFTAIGDSLSHGAQSMCIDENRQKKSFIALMAQQMGTDFNQPLLKFPGFFVNLEDLGKGNIKWFEFVIPLSGGQRVDGYRDQDKMNNFAVSGATTGDVLNVRGGTGLFDIAKLVLGKNGDPQIDQALSKNPTFVSAWIGGNDVLGSALGTDPANLTDFETFKAQYLELARRISETSSVQGVITSTLPDLTVLAYLQDANDPDVPQGSKKAFWNTSVSDNDEVLDPQEMEYLTQKTVEMNEEIKRIAAANNWALMDGYNRLKDACTFGYVLKYADGTPGPITLTGDYLGGLYSLDGFHPSTSGHAYMANLMIKAINNHYGQNLALVDEVRAAENDSLLQNPYDPRGVIDSWFGQTVQQFLGWFGIL